MTTSSDSPTDRNGLKTLPGTRLPVAGLVHLGVMYVVWSSTYLAIRIAVREGAGFSPFMLGFLRLLPASLILLAWGFLRGNRVRPTRREMKTLAVTGLMIWVGGNGMVNWAEQHADSGLTALILGALPIYVAVMEAVIDRRVPSWRLTTGLLLGFAGIGALTWPVLRDGVQADLLALGGLLFAPLSWGLGSILIARRPVDLSAPVTSGWQQLVAMVGFLAVAMLRSEPLPAPTGEAWAAWAYLVVAGSLVAFTSYMAALKLLPTPLVMTYAYVNPVLAMFLGWLVLGERLGAFTFLGAGLVLLGVAFVFDDRKQRRSPARRRKLGVAK